ncbi:hypothetical protein PK35_13035 [Tamlana nanhaiensis]|uniref:DUF306 domain-containing protein n=1 Tax=Neotamlana nanhaiensis TaxID=1382798 RepID=A0A0D7VXR8_9FLAO|nr:META domain-containing protein [Tamlana nanhaiensis]KJD31680.1 hypothetical protein PK35_13035 [Tamlana nanhaiensis]
MKSILLAFAFVLLKCGGDASNQKTMQINETQNLDSFPELHGDYTINKLHGDDVSTFNLKINFDKETQKVYGFSGCNRFFGTFSLNNSTLAFNNMASTKRMCRPELVSTENALLKALNEADSVTFTNTGFSVFNNGNLLLSALNENVTSIVYKATSRGFFKEVVIDEDNVSTAIKRGGTPVKKACEKASWDQVLVLLNAIDFNKISELKAPSKKYAFDGAALAHLTIIKNGKTYESAPFDHGNPPKEIANLVKEILSLSENIE